MCYCSFLRFQIRRLAIPNKRPPTRFITGDSTAAVFGKIGCGCSGTFGVGLFGVGLFGVGLSGIGAGGKSPFGAGGVYGPGGGVFGAGGNIFTS